MSTRRFVLRALFCSLALSGCKDKKPAPAPEPPAGSAVAPVAVRPGVPPATERDVDFEKNREELLRRGDPAMMQPAPVISDAEPAASPIKAISKDVMMVGPIRVDLAAGTASMPAVVSINTGVLEYVAVQTGGKLYESLLSVEASAVELRLALTLLGFEGTPPDASGTIPAAGPADSVTIAVEIDGKERPLSSLMIDRKTGKAPADAAWQVVGFRDADRSSALRTKDLLTLVPRDVLAPMRRAGDAGNPYAGPDQGLAANPKTLPAPATKIHLVIHRGPGAPTPKTAPTATTPTPTSPGATP